MKINAIKIINEEGADFAYFTDKLDLYTKLSGAKDSMGENLEFVEIGNTIQLNDEVLKVKNINLKFENVDFEIQHSQKLENPMPTNIIIEVVITVKFVGKI